MKKFFDWLVSMALIICLLMVAVWFLRLFLTGGVSV